MISIGVQVDDIAELHYITSGLKAVVTHLTGQGIEQARMSCGGHGYSKATNIPELYGRFYVKLMMGQTKLVVINWLS